MVHNGLQAYKRFVAMPILRKFETEVNTFFFMYMNSRDVIICYLELRKTRSVFPIPLEFEISKFACIYTTYEPRREKTGFLKCENKDADQRRGNHGSDQCLCFRYTDNTIPLLTKYEISSLKPGRPVYTQRGSYHSAYSSALFEITDL